MFVITFCNCNVFKTVLEALASTVKKKNKQTWGKRTRKGETKPHYVQTV